ncbi:MAG TPA: DNA recombination protein RmuC, partial [Tenuifilaceae bacterium]|nr:DNA recombination protein RmuC [Tenuifilaceae bacterium]
MTGIVLVGILVVLAVVGISILLIRKPTVDIKPQLREVENLMVGFGATLDRVEKSIKDEFQRNRAETNEISKTNREELTKSLDTFSSTFEKSVKELNDVLKAKYDELRNQQADFNRQISDANKANREELANSLKSFETKFTENIRELNELLRQKFSDFSQQQTEVNRQLTENIKDVKQSVDNQLKSIREDNTHQLDEMRKTVDEKLQKTLNDRLSQSFETVGKQLQAVQVGLGEMKNLAADVGGLKRVLSNVKMRGGIGEIQLSMLLEQILAPDQYEA